MATYRWIYDSVTCGLTDYTGISAGPYARPQIKSNQIYLRHIVQHEEANTIVRTKKKCVNKTQRQDKHNMRPKKLGNKNNRTIAS